MTKEEIVKGNELIMKFMNNEIEICGRRLFADEFDSYAYHFSWEWLMQAVSKIEGIKHPVYIHGNTCDIYEHANKNKGWSVSCIYPTKIEAVWNAIIKFITWYNEGGDDK